jgi:hypothetical protein
MNTFILSLQEYIATEILDQAKQSKRKARKPDEEEMDSTTQRVT